MPVELYIYNYTKFVEKLGIIYQYEHTGQLSDDNRKIEPIWFA